MMSETRLRIYQYVLANPGVHFRGIVRGLTLNVGVVQYHTNWLERHGQLYSRGNRLRRYFYAKEKIHVR